LCARGAEEETLVVFGNPGSIDIGAQRFGERAMARHRVFLAAFLVKPDGPSRAARPEILDFHFQRRTDARKALGEGSDQGPVAQIALARAEPADALAMPGMLRKSHVFSAAVPEVRIHLPPAESQMRT
jgi:hypothetical protein